MPTPEHLLLVRPGFESDLVSELAAAGLSASACGPGLVRASGQLPPAPFIFERQRLPDAGFLSEPALKPVTDETLGAVTARLRASAGPWLLQVYATEPELHDRAAGFARAVLRLVERHVPAVAARQVDGATEADPLVVQLCRVAGGLWYSTAPRSALTSPWVGGIARMRDDPRAPSRSYLKIEEAFARMGLEPTPGQTAVDLGAAPGGWTLALAKRGCHVIAVDNGPLRLPPPEAGWGRVDYVRANGITFEPRQPVDWLVADMLVAPGVVLGLLRRWIGQRLLRQCVVNVKIPQADAYAAVAPIAQYVQSQGSGFSVQLCQLYHDRDEITVMGRALPR